MEYTLSKDFGHKILCLVLRLAAAGWPSPAEHRNFATEPKISIITTTWCFDIEVLYEISWWKCNEIGECFDKENTISVFFIKTLTKLEFTLHMILFHLI